MDLTTPALLFPAISLLFLAYTNRFIVLAQLVRDLHSRYTAEPNDILLRQIENLQKRLNIIRYMQVFGAASFFLCVLCMFLLFANNAPIADMVFVGSLLLLMASLGLCLWEIHISIEALTVQLSDFKTKTKTKKHN